MKWQLFVLLGQFFRSFLFLCGLKPIWNLFVFLLRKLCMDLAISIDFSVFFTLFKLPSESINIIYLFLVVSSLSYIFYWLYIANDSAVHIEHFGDSLYDNILFSIITARQISFVNFDASVYMWWLFSWFLMIFFRRFLYMDGFVSSFFNSAKSRLSNWVIHAGNL